MSEAKAPPVVKGLPVLGSIPQLLTDFPKLLLETAPATGDIARIKVGFYPKKQSSIYRGSGLDSESGRN